MSHEENRFRKIAIRLGSLLTLHEPGQQQHTPSSGSCSRRDMAETDFEVAEKSQFEGPAVGESVEDHNARHEAAKLHELKGSVPESPFSLDKLREWLIALLEMDSLPTLLYLEFRLTLFAQHCVRLQC